MPTFRQMSETVSPLARSRSASRSNRATSSAVLRLLMGPSVSQSTRRLPFRLDQFLGSRPAVGVAGLGWFFTTYGKGGPLYAVFSVLLLIGLLVWGLIHPVVGRRLARTFAVIAMGLGMGLLLWGISGAVSGERLRPPFGSNIITQVSEAIGWGAGFLTGGIVALVLSFLGKTIKISPQDTQGSELTSEYSDHAA